MGKIFIESEIFLGNRGNLKQRGNASVPQGNGRPWRFTKLVLQVARYIQYTYIAIYMCFDCNCILEGSRETVTETSPVWVPDVDANVCMHCRKSEFSVINRRVRKAVMLSIGI